MGDPETRGIVGALIGELDARHLLAPHPGCESGQVLAPVEVRVDEHAVAAEAPSREPVEVRQHAAGRRPERRDDVQKRERREHGRPQPAFEERGDETGQRQDQEGIGGEQVTLADLDAGEAGGHEDDGGERQPESERDAGARGRHRGAGRWRRVAAPGRSRGASVSPPPAQPESHRQREQKAGRVLHQERDRLVVPPAGAAALAEQIGGLAALVVLRLEAQAVEVGRRQGVRRLHGVEHACGGASGARGAQQLARPRPVVEAVGRPDHDRDADERDGKPRERLAPEGTAAVPIAQRDEERAHEDRQHDPGRDAGRGGETEGQGRRERARQRRCLEPAPEGPGGEDEKGRGRRVDRGEMAVGEERRMEGGEQRGGDARRRAGHGPRPEGEQKGEREREQRGRHTRAPQQAAGGVVRVHELPAPGERALRRLERRQVEAEPQQAEAGERLRERGVRRVQPVVAERELPVAGRDVEHLVVRHAVRGDAPGELQREHGEQKGHQRAGDGEAGSHAVRALMRSGLSRGGRSRVRRAVRGAARRAGRGSIADRSRPPVPACRAPAGMAYCALMPANTSHDSVTGRGCP